MEMLRAGGMPPPSVPPPPLRHRRRLHQTRQPRRQREATQQQAAKKRPTDTPRPTQTQTQTARSRQQRRERSGNSPRATAMRLAAIWTIPTTKTAMATGRARVWMGTRCCASTKRCRGCATGGSASSRTVWPTSTGETTSLHGATPSSSGRRARASSSGTRARVVRACEFQVFHRSCLHEGGVHARPSRSAVGGTRHSVIVEELICRGIGHFEGHFELGQARYGLPPRRSLTVGGWLGHGSAQ